jgi:outer membrane protein
MRCLAVCLMTFWTAVAGPLGAQEGTVPSLPPDPFLVRLAPPDERTAEGPPLVNLAQAVALALERNFSLLNAADSVASARYRYGAARAQFWPQLTPRLQRGEDSSLYALDVRQRLPWTGGSVSAAGTFLSEPRLEAPLTRSSELSLTLTQPLLRGFGPNATFFDLRNNRRARQAQERTFELTRQRVAVDVTRAFYQVVQQRMLLAVARQSFERSEGLEKASDARLEVGLVSKLDVFRAQLQSSQAQEAMIRSEAALQDALESFRFLLGLAPHDPLEPEEVVLAEVLADEPLEPLPVLVERALANRLDLQETRDQVDDARRNASLARQNLLPQLDLNVAVSQSGRGPAFGEALRAGDRRTEVILTASYPLERSQDRAVAAVARLDVDARGRALQQRELEVESEVRSAVRDLEQIRKSVQLQRKGVDVAEQQHRLATLRYQRGLASNFDVVDAESNLVLARSTLVGLLTRYQVARLDLLRVTGALDVDVEFLP